MLELELGGSRDNCYVLRGVCFIVTLCRICHVDGWLVFNGPFSINTLYSDMGV